MNQKNTNTHGKTLARKTTLTLENTFSDALDKLEMQVREQEDMVTHNHDFFELVYVAGGQTKQTLNGDTMPLKQGDYFIMDYASEHAYENSQDLKLINCLFFPEIIDDTLQGCRSYDDLIKGCLLKYYKLIREGQSPVNHVFQDVNGRVKAALQVMYEEYVAKEVGYKEVLRNRLLEVIVLAMRNLIDKDQEGVKDDLISGLMSYYHQHFAQKNPLSVFCREHHYSPQYISRRFKEETGVTSSYYIKKCRMEKSCELLAGTKLQVEVVAEAVGYSNGKYFTDVFKEMIGMTPRAYRSTN